MSWRATLEMGDGGRRAPVDDELVRSSRDSDGRSAVVDATTADPAFPEERDVLGATGGPGLRRIGCGANDCLASSLVLSQ